MKKDLLNAIVTVCRAYATSSVSFEAINTYSKSQMALVIDTLKTQLQIKEAKALEAKPDAPTLLPPTTPKPKLKVVKMPKANLNDIAKQLRLLAEDFESTKEHSIQAVVTIIGAGNGETAIKGWGPRSSPIEVLGWLSRAKTKLGMPVQIVRDYVTDKNP